MFINNEPRSSRCAKIAALKGVIVPLVTPLAMNEELDLIGLGKVIDHVIDGGVDAIFSLGTTGEFARFDSTFRAHVARETVKAAAGRVPVLIGVSDTGTKRVLENMASAEAAGADAIVLSLPYYFPIKDPREILDFYAAVAAISRLPIFLYNIPSTCGAAIDIESFRKLASLEGVVGIKDSSGSIHYLKSLIQVATECGKKPFPVYVGEEKIAAEGIAAGASGLVPSLANVFPRLFADLYAAAAAGDREKTTILSTQVVGMNAINLYSGSSLSAVAWRKTALAMMGLCGETMTAPFVPVEGVVRASITQLIRARG
jgi:4-hydroxy-tetrahydrodipicolinate synthase